MTRRIGAKELSPVEVVDAVLDRMEGLEPILHAFCWPTPFVPPRRPRGSRRSATAWHHQPLKGRPRGLRGGLAQRRGLQPIRFAKRK